MKKIATKAATRSGATTAKPRPRRGANAVKPEDMAVPIDLAFQPVAAVFAKDPGVRLGRRFSSNSVLSVNGKIFAMLVKGSFVAKLPEERVAALVRTGAGKYFDPGHGRLMKEWVAVVDATTPWVALAKEAHVFVKAGSR